MDQALDRRYLRCGNKRHGIHGAHPSRHRHKAELDLKTRALLTLSIILTLCVALPSLVYAEATNLKHWNISIPISSDILTLDCAALLRPVELGRLLSEPDPINVPAEFDEALRSAHEIKVKLTPQTGTTDNLSTINGCLQDGEELLLTIQVPGHSITLIHSNQLELPNNTNFVLNDVDKFIALRRINSKWVTAYVSGASGSGGGGGGGGDITDAICPDEHQIGDGTSYFGFCVDEVDGPIFSCVHDGDDCDLIFNIANSKVYELHGNGVLFERMTASGTHSYHNAGRPTDIREWLAPSMIGDNVQCDRNPTLENINNVDQFGIRCPMSSSETSGFIKGLGLTLPRNFDKTGDITFEIRAYLITDGGAGTWHGKIMIDCVEPGAQPGTWGTAVGLDLTPVDGDIVDDVIYDIGAAVVDTDTTGADCDPGDTIIWQWESCDTDASPPSGCSSSAGFENDMSIFSVLARFYVNSRSE